MADSIRIEGLDGVLESLADIKDVSKIERALKKACALVERSAKQKAPKGETGELARSISSRVEVDGDELVGIVFTALEYAPYVEFGTGLFAVKGGRQDVPWCYQDEKGEWHTTSGQHPQPFLGPALNENREQILKTLQEGQK